VFDDFPFSGAYSKNNFCHAVKKNNRSVAVSLKQAFVEALRKDKDSTISDLKRAICSFEGRRNILAIERRILELYSEKINALDGFETSKQLSKQDLRACDAIQKIPRSYALVFVLW